MRKFILSLLSIMVLISSCASTYNLTYQESKKEVEGENAFIKLKSGEELNGRIIEVGLDSTFNAHLRPDENIIIPASEVLKSTIGITVKV